MMASNESCDRVRANKFSTKHVFRQKKRVQQLRDACANRTFSTAKQPDTAEMQLCIATAGNSGVFSVSIFTSLNAGSSI